MRSARGFTLIELLVVLVVIGVMVGLAVFSIGDRPQRAQLAHEASRLASLSQIVLDKTFAQNKEWGLRIDHDRYRFYMFDGKHRQWLSINDLPLAQKNNLLELTEHSLPSNLWLRVQIEDQHITLAPAEDNTDVSIEQSPPANSVDQTDIVPHILFLSSGEYTPFIIDMGLQGQSSPLATLYGDGLAPLKLLTGKDSEDLRRP